MPSGEAQVALMKSVYRCAGLDPKDTGFVEAHGTGTKVREQFLTRFLGNISNHSGNRSLYPTHDNFDMLMLFRERLAIQLKHLVFTKFLKTADHLGSPYILGLLNPILAIWKGLAVSFLL